MQFWVALICGFELHWFTAKLMGGLSDQYQTSIEKQEQIIVGPNQFQTHEPLHLDRTWVDPVIEFEQRSRLAELRKTGTTLA